MNTTMASTPAQLSIRHTAELLDYSKRTVYRLIARGELETTGSGQLLRITYASILAYQERIRNRKGAA